jgi:hypothetical protein
MTENRGETNRINSIPLQITINQNCVTCKLEGIGGGSIAVYFATMIDCHSADSNQNHGGSCTEQLLCFIREIQTFDHLICHDK